MIDYIKGSVAELNPAYAVIDINGVGYLLNISLTTYNEIIGKSEAKLYAFEAIREDAHLLYGFASKIEREMFTLLISVSGVGPNTARLILSSLVPAQLQSTIASGNATMLKAVKGIGAKTAQRIIVDLKDKINAAGDALINMEASGEIFDEALGALVMLGFARPASQKVLQKLFSEHPDLDAEGAIKLALKMM